MSKNILIIGGAGFIGSNASKYYLENGDKVIIFDNFSRKGCKSNIQWLQELGGKLQVVEGDIRHNTRVLRRIVAEANKVLHLAGQVAVTTSVENPLEDFEINAGGTMNVLEAIRKSDNKPPLIYSSTNKVYGGMENAKVAEKKTRYVYKSFPYGISEEFPLDFHSPYGCSKGASDQYVRDYARVYGLQTVVFRQSCIYGPRQYGVEDQGWLAWFIIALLNNKKITIYGDGKQVRDVLYIDDLVKAYDLAFENMGKISGSVYNVGGGPKHSLSVWCELRPILEDLLDKEIEVDYGGWRPGDQKIFISDIRKIKKDLGWSPKIEPKKGIKRLLGWVKHTN
ncbi:GDP-mannose 4,6-dehydratase [Patescibacteria group bacterium]